MIEKIDSMYKNEDNILFQHAIIFLAKPKETGELILNFGKKRSFEPDSMALINLYTYKTLIK